MSALARAPAVDAWRGLSGNLEEACATQQDWASVGMALGEIAHSVMWQIGAWWNLGERYGDRVAIVQSPDWTGPAYGTCRVAGRVATRWEVLNRFNTLSFKHHAVVAALPNEQAKPLLAWAAETPEPRSTRELAAKVKKVARAAKEADLGAKQLAAPEGLFGVIYADPPWQFEPYSRDSGMDRAADNHYPCMSLEDLCALPVPAADDCVLFLWATSPMAPHALKLMAAWGFTYKSHCVWVKDRVGTGYWFRNCHELLLVGTRGDIPAPAFGEQYASTISAPVGRHSEKPAAFAEMIEDMYPTLPALEMFARSGRVGWTSWGYEAPPP